MTGNKILGYVMNHNFDIDDIVDLNLTKRYINKLGF